MGKAAFCERLVFLERKLIEFSSRCYLPTIYAAGGNLVLRCSRQTEKSTFLVNTILYEACTRPGLKILFVCPRAEQARVFSNRRLLPSLEQSPIIRRVLMGQRQQRLPITNMEFANGSTLAIRAAYLNADACRGLSADLLLVDEFQDVAQGDLPVLQETLSHSSIARTILTGTPKSIDNHLDLIFGKSTANEWTLPCPTCDRSTILDERCLGPHSIICPGCHAQLEVRAGRWVPRNAHASWGEGYCVSHLMVPWLDFEDVLDRKTTYDFARFKNEVLGLPTTLGDHIVTREELEACCGNESMTDSLGQIPAFAQSHLIAGVDWGGGGTSRTVLVIGFMLRNFTFRVCRIERYTAQEDPNYVLNQIALRCKQFRIFRIAADGGGNGSVLNRLLLDRLDRRNGLYAISYGSTGQEPQREGALVRWHVHRSASIGALFTRVKNRTVRFPRLAESDQFLDEIACEVGEFDDLNRTIRYVHPESQPDDVLHALNYALLVAGLAFSQQRQL